MTPSSPTHRRRPAARLLGAGGAAAAAAALALASVLPAASTASAASSTASASPPAPGSDGVPEVSARIAFVDWCGRGGIGHTGTDGGTGSGVTADWTDDPGGVAGGGHFASEPDDAYSSVVYDRGRLTAAAGVTGVRFAPRCRFDDSGTSTPASLTDAFGRDALLVLDSAASTAWWSAASGPSAQITVRGLEILGRHADVSDGDYTGTFTADAGDGEITVAVTAERSVNETARPEQSRQTPAGESRHRRAEAFLSVRFRVARIGADGTHISEFDYGVEFAGTAVHVPASGAAGTPAEPETGTGSPGPGTGLAAPDTAGPLEEHESEPEGTPPATGPSGGGEPEAAPQSPTPAGATADPAASPGGGEDTGPLSQRRHASGPTVAAPTAPEDAPSVGPGGADPGTDPRGGRLPVAGSALIGLVATGLAALGGGGTAIYLGRGRKSGFDGDDVVASRVRPRSRDWP